MNALVPTIFAAALLVSAPAVAEEAHHAPSGGAGAAATDTTAQPDMKGSMSSNGAAGMMNPDMMKQMMGMHSEMMSPEYVEGRIAFLRTELKITPAQEPLWNAVTDALRAETTASKGMMPTMSENMAQSDASREALPQKMSQMESNLSSQLDRLRRLNAALEPFYEALDESQKALADKLLVPMGMM